MTGDELVEFTRNELLLDTATPPLWSDDAILTYLNEAQNQFCRKTYALQDDASSVTQLPLTSGNGAYSLDQSILYVFSGYLDGQANDLSNYTRRFIPNQLSGSTGTPKMFAMDEASYYLRVYPIPDDSFTLKLRVARLPADPITSSTEPEIPQQYHIDLPEYAAYRCLKNAETDGSNLGASAEFKKSWDGRVTAAKREYYRFRMGANATAQNSVTGRRNGYGR